MSEPVSPETDLPYWVELIIQDKEAKAYTRGWEEGQANLWYLIEHQLREARPYSA